VNGDQTNVCLWFPTLEFRCSLGFPAFTWHWGRKSTRIPPPNSVLRKESEQACIINFIYTPIPSLTHYYSLTVGLDNDTTPPLTTLARVDRTTQQPLPSATIGTPPC